MAVHKASPLRDFDPFNLEDRRTLAGRPEVVQPGTQPIERPSDPFMDKFERFDFDREIKAPAETKEESVDFDPTSTTDRREVAGRPEVAGLGTERVERPDDPFEEKNERFGLDDEVVLSEGSSLEKPAPQEGTPPPGEEDQISKNIKEHEANVAALEELRKWRDEQLAGATNQRDRQRIEKEYLDLVNQVQQGRRDEALDEIGVARSTEIESDNFVLQEQDIGDMLNFVVSHPKSEFSIPATGTVTNHMNLIINEAANPEYNLNTDQLAYIFATAHWESHWGYFDLEAADGSGYDNLEELGNSQSGEGELYKGRGFVQLTGRANYQTYSDIMGIDLINNPNFAYSPENSAFIIVHGMVNGNFGGYTLEDFDDGKQFDFFEARSIVNSEDFEHFEDIGAMAEDYAYYLSLLCTAGFLPSTIQCVNRVGQP